MLIAGLIYSGVSRDRTASPREELSVALAALEAGEPQPAEEAIRRLGSRNDCHSHVGLLRGAVLLRAGDPAAALEEFERLSPTDDVRPHALRLTGECLYKLGRLPEAAWCFEMLAEEESTADAHRWLAAISFDLGIMNQAVANLEQVAQLDPGDYRPHRMMGMIHKDFEQYGPAVRNYRDALQRNPPADVRDELVRALAETLMKQGRFDEALTVLDTTGPDPVLVALRSECLWNTGRREEAEQVFEQPTTEAPRDVAVLRWRARLLTETGRVRDAIPVLRTVLEMEPHHVESRYQLALALQRSGEGAAAAAEMERVEASKRLLTRLTELSERSMRESANADLRDEMAAVCERLGRHEMAAVWRKAAAMLRAARAGRTGASARQASSPLTDSSAMPPSG